MNFKSIALLTVACASAAALAQQDRNQDSDNRSSTHNRQNSGSSTTSGSSSTRSSGSGRIYGSSRSQSYGSSHGYGSHNSESNGSRTGSGSSGSFGSRSSYGYSHTSTDNHHSGKSYGSGSSFSHSSSSSSRGYSSESPSSFRSDFGELRHSPSTYESTSRNQGSGGHSWTDRYTGGSSHSYGSGSYHSGIYQSGTGYHSNSGFEEAHGSFAGHGTSNGGGRGFDRGRLAGHDTWVHQSSRWGGGWRSGWSRPSGFGIGLGLAVGFSFGFYLADRFAAPCYVSPWYYYDCLPPYIPSARCVVVPDYSCNWSEGVSYDWSDGDGNRALDDAVLEIQDAYSHQNLDAVDQLVPTYGEVAVSTDGHYDYSLKSNDFGQMFTDSVKGTQTVSFQVDNVRRYGAYATVHCTHEVRGSDGDTETVYQTYRLKKEEGHYVVCDFMTEHSSEF